MNYRPRTPFNVFCLAALVAAGSTVLVRAAAMPPPPPVVTSAGTADATRRRIVLACAGEDSVFVDPIVRPAGLGNVAVIPGPGSALRYALASGDTLRLDGSTPGGVYPLADGQVVTLGPALGYPRNYAIRHKPHPTLGFCVSSRRCMGVLVASRLTSLFGEAHDARLLEQFRSSAQYRSARVVNDKSLAFAIPRDWYRRAEIELPDSLTDYRVLFIVYGGIGPAPSLEPNRRVGTARFSMAPPPATPSVALPGSSPLTIVGEVLLLARGTNGIRVERVR